MSDIRERLQKPFSDELVETFRQGGEELDFVPWHEYARRLNRATEGWSSRVVDMEVVGQNLIMVVEVTVNGETHSGTGEAEANKDSWGGAHAEAYSQAFRRACAHFGLGLYFYRDQEVSASRPTRAPEPDPNAMTDTQKERLRELAETGEFGDKELDRFRDRIKSANNKKGVAGTVIRKMKEEYESRTGEPFDNSQEQ